MFIGISACQNCMPPPIRCTHLGEADNQGSRGGARIDKLLETLESCDWPEGCCLRVFKHTFADKYCLWSRQHSGDLKRQNGVNGVLMSPITCMPQLPSPQIRLANRSMLISRLSFERFIESPSSANADSGWSRPALPSYPA